MPGSNGAGGGIRAARPSIVVAGQVQPALVDGLLGLSIVENVSGLYRCEAVFGNWGNVQNSIGFLYFDRRTLDFGKALTVKIGSDVIFDGRITGLEAHYLDGRPPQICVLAEDRFQDLRMTRRTRTFADVTDADVITQVANEHGLSPSVDVTGPSYTVLAQVNQSDLAFVRERARAVGAEVWMEGNTLNARSRASRTSATLELAYGGRLREFSVLSDLAGQRTSVTVSGWDVAGKTALQHEADESVIGGELNGDASGAAILETALGRRKEALVHTVPLTSREAQAEAEAFYRMSARRFVTGRGIADTDSRLRVGIHVNLRGLGPLFSGKYYVSEVQHLFDGVRGIRTEFAVERPGLGRV